MTTEDTKTVEETPAEAPPPKKKCKGPCGEMLDPGKFKRSENSADGRVNVCRECRSNMAKGIHRTNRTDKAEIATSPVVSPKAEVLSEADLQESFEPLKSVGKPTLGQYLTSIRAARQMTLRQVEQATNKDVSNAYLCQIESDKIRQPTPHILLAIAKAYGIDYWDLMERAGYVISPPPASCSTGEFAAGR